MRHVKNFWATLVKARKPDRYHYDRETFESLVEQIASCFARAIPNEGPPMTPTAGRAMKLKDRYGIPPEHAQPLDRPHIFLDRLHSVTSMQRNLSSLEVRRSVYYAFFGKPSSQTYMPYTPPPWLPASEPSSPLFDPRDNIPADGPFAEDMSISGLSERSSSSRRGLSENSRRPTGRAAAGSTAFATADSNAQFVSGQRAFTRELRRKGISSHCGWVNRPLG